jgi:hypothetical protein
VRVWQRLKRLWGPRAIVVPRAWLHCPICDRDLVGPYPPGSFVSNSPGPEWLAPNRDELVAKCPVHGRAPFNEGERSKLWSNYVAKSD